MSTITDADILQRFSQLSDAAKKEILLAVDCRIREELRPEKNRAQPGWGKHHILRYEEDFEPYEDFKEYME